MISKILALCLAIVLSLAMGVTALAAITSESKAKITVNNLEPNMTVTGYQIITVNINENGQPQDPVFLWDEQIADWLRNNNYEEYVRSQGGHTNAVSESFRELQNDSEVIKNFSDKLLYAIRTADSGFERVDKIEANTGEDSSAVFAEAPMGYYLLSVTGGEKIYQPTTVELVPTYADEWGVTDVTVDMKGQLPTIDKEVTSKPTVAVGDTVSYELSVLVPEYPDDAVKKTLVVGDKLGNGLDFNNDIKVLSEGQQISNDNNENYTVNTEKETATFEITFTKEFLESPAYAGQNITITYSATVNERAFEEDALGNEAYMGYNDPYTGEEHKPGDKAKVYTYGIRVLKEDKSTAKALAGAEFVLESPEGSKLSFNGSEGAYVLAKEGGNSVLAVNDSGELMLKGLNTGIYILKETKAPDGYVLPSGKVTITITDEGPEYGTIDQGSAVADGGIQIKGEATISSNVISLIVQNTNAEDAGFTLPTTGGMGTTIFTIVGILLMGGAAAMVVMISRRKKHGNE